MYFLGSAPYRQCVGRGCIATVANLRISSADSRVLPMQIWGEGGRSQIIVSIRSTVHIIVFDWIVFETYRYRILGCWSSAQDTMSGNAKKGRDEFVGG